MQIVKHYRDNKALRDSFNQLAEQIFGLNFENWYAWGFWGDNYDPYSVVMDGKVVANVSVNRTDLVIGGERRKFYQLGTVMTDPAYRNRGYIRAIMAEVERDIAGADGVYLFGNNNVGEFYPKFGFVPGKEFLYSRPVEAAGEGTMVQVPMEGPGDWDCLAKAIAESKFETGCAMADNPGLIFFYVTQFMRENVFYSGELNAWAIGEMDERELLLHNVFGPKDLSLDAVIAAFGKEMNRVTLGFAPAEATGFAVTEYHEEDCNFFVLGEGFRDFAERRLRIPTLSHA